MSSEEFSRIYENVRPRLQISFARAKVLYETALNASVLPGEFWECGVFSGGSARILADVLCGAVRPLRLFDTFSGFPSVSAEDGAYPRTGMFSDTNVDSVMSFVSADFAVAHEGPIPSTFHGLEDSKIAFAYLDVDLYEPTRDSLAFILPRMVAGGAVVIDDYGDPHWPGVEKAVEEFWCLGLSYHVYGEHDRQAVIQL